MKQYRMSVTFTGTEEVLRRLLRFLAFFHYNGGHSGLFAMPFDGDGSDRLTVEPPPPEEYRKALAISHAGLGVEVAEDRGTSAYRVVWVERCVANDSGVVSRVNKDGTETVIRRPYREETLDGGE